MGANIDGNSQLHVSPSQLSQNRRMRSNLIMKSELLKPKLNHKIKEEFEQKQMITRTYYNRNAISRESFIVGRKVLVQGQDKLWRKGIITLKCSQPRSFIVDLENGSRLRRNSFFLKHLKDTPMSSEIKVRKEKIAP
jgi:hypothetical protein